VNQLTIYIIIIPQGVPKKTARSFALDKFWTICHRMALFTPKCSAKIIYLSINAKFE